ncbi:MAG: molybdate ABC transporter substrate-binding protein, partial [Halioglobus sp.]|nr:molybdate ABC transporter substrate-binding protein [Halioglobus sp.]
PFDLFLAADAAAPQRLFNERGGPSVPTCYAVGRLALAGGKLTALAAPHNSLAIANPATAPYGRAAMSVLERAEFESGGQRKLVRGNNVVQALQFFASGAVDLALLPAAIAPGDAASVPAQWHAPIEQHLLLLRDSPRARSYLKWLRSDRVRSLIEDAGYKPCP